MKAVLSRSSLFGRVILPGSKSHTIRAALLAGLASGVSKIYDPLIADDTCVFARGLASLGVQIAQDHVSFVIEGMAGRLQEIRASEIDVGESGLSYRFLTALAAHSRFPILIRGRKSLQRRTIWPLTVALQQLGVNVTFLQTPGFLPFVIQGPMYSGRCQILDGADSQHLSSLLLSLPFLQGESSVCVHSMGEHPWIELTQWWLRFCSLEVTRVAPSSFCISGNQTVSSFSYRVKKDMSAIAFPLAAAVMSDASIEIEGIGEDDAQGDRVIFDYLRRMGAVFEIEQGICRIQGPQSLYGIDIDMNDAVDLLPVLAVLATKAKTPTRLYGGYICRYKESNRIKAICQELRKLGAHIREHVDGVTVFPSSLFGTRVYSHGDHRIAMALIVAGLSAENETTVYGVDAIAKTFPQFCRSLQRIGANVCVSTYL